MVKTPGGARGHLAPRRAFVTPGQDAAFKLDDMVRSEWLFDHYVPSTWERSWNADIELDGDQLEKVRTRSWRPLLPPVARAHV